MATKKTESILGSVKQVLGIVPEYEYFDSQLILFINSVFPTLYELGVGPDNGFEIEDESAEWAELTNDSKLLAQVKSYVYIKVRLLFDPPASSFALDSMNKMAQEMEWRILAMVEPTNRPMGGSANG